MLGKRTFHAEDRSCEDSEVLGPWLNGTKTMGLMVKEKGKTSIVGLIGGLRSWIVF